MEVDDEQLNSTMLSLETKSVQPYRSQDEYLYAMKEDLAEWFNTLYGLEMGVDDFFEQLETGVVLCQHANNVQSFILQRLSQVAKNKAATPKKPLPNLDLMDRAVSYRSSAKEGSFQSRDNISNFITWCRRLGIDDVLMFESDDLVLRKNERSVVLCLLEVARRGARYGMLAPQLIQLEEEIDAEIAGEDPPAPPVQRKMVDLMSLDEMVREMVSVCTCPDQFPVIRVSEGKYQVGESHTLIFVRILRNHVMVRIGGGWDTLQNYLNRHDPCRCSAKGHKVVGSRSQTGHIHPQGVNRRSSVPANPITGHESRSATPRSFTPELQSSQSVPPQRKNRSQSLFPGKTSHDISADSGRAAQKATPHRSLDTAVYNQSLHGGPKPHRDAVVRPKSAKQSSMLNSPLISRKVLNSSPTKGLGTPANNKSRQQRTGGLSLKDIKSIAELDKYSASIAFNNMQAACARNGNATPLRPQSARDRGRSRGSSPGPRSVGSDRGRSQSRERVRSDNSVDYSKSERSRSLGASELQKQLLNRTAPLGSLHSTKEVLIVSRDGSGRHNVTPLPSRNGKQLGGKQRPITPRVQITPDKILPNKPKILSRSQSQNDEMYDNSEIYQSKHPKLGTAGQSMSLSGSLEDTHDIPPENDDLNKKMELLFQEYLKIELGQGAKSPTSPVSVQPGRRRASVSSDDNSSVSSYSTESSLSFQKSGSSSREGISQYGPNSTRKNPAVHNGVCSTRAAAKHNHSAMKASQSISPKVDCYNAHVTSGQSRGRSSTPVSGRSSSLSRQSSNSSVDSGPHNHLNVSNSYNSRTYSVSSTESQDFTWKSGHNGRAQSAEDLLDDERPRERGRTPVRGTTNGRANSKEGPSKGRRDGEITANGTRQRSYTPGPSITARRHSETPRPASAMSVRSKPASDNARSSSVRKQLFDAPSKRSATPVRPASARPHYRRERSQSKEDILNCDRPERGRLNAVTSASRQRSASTTVLNRKRMPAKDKAAQTSPPKEILSSEMAADLLAMAASMHEIEKKLMAKPRKDEKPGRTRIPMPTHQQRQGTDCGQPLKRFDSGVDIATVSPTDSSIHGDENWHHDILYSSDGVTFTHSPQHLNPHTIPPSTYAFADGLDDSTEYF